MLSVSHIRGLVRLVCLTDDRNDLDDRHNIHGLFETKPLNNPIRPKTSQDLANPRQRVHQRLARRGESVFAIGAQVSKLAQERRQSLQRAKGSGVTVFVISSFL